MALATIPTKLNPQDNSFSLNIAWIGDSRIYFLSPEKGLQQLTQDDLTVQNDAFKLIYEDSPMSKYITADLHSDWKLNFKVEKFTEKGCVLACTDGCFQCLDSPWAFERLLLDTLAQSETMIDWQNLLIEAYEKIKQDDVSLVLYPVGFDDFCSLKSSYQERLNKIHKYRYSKTNSYEELRKLWSIYCQDYEERLAETYKEDKINSIIKENNKNFSLQANNKCDRVTNHVETLSAENAEALPSRDVNIYSSILKELEEVYSKLKEKEYCRAKSLYPQLVSHDPNNFDAKLKIGETYAKLGDFERESYFYLYKHLHYYSLAIEWFESAFKVPVDKNITLEERKKFAILLEKADRDNKAIEVCKEIIEIEPNYAYAFQLIGFIQSKQKKLKNAIENLSIALRIYQEEGYSEAAKQLQIERDNLLR